MLRNFCIFLLGACLVLTAIVLNAGLITTGVLLICCDIICFFMAGIAHYEEM